MSRDLSQRISDMVQAIDRCRRYSATLDSDDSDLADMARDAIERNLQIIGEAANHLPPDFTRAHPGIPWPQVRGFRNILVHQYFGVDGATVKEVVEAHLPSLAAVLHSQINP